MTQNQFEAKNRLISLLRSVGQERVWRTVYDENGDILHPGHADMRDGNPDYLDQLDFRDKTVLDIGCNFGFYSFLARRRGASMVTGVDTDAEAVQGCRLLTDVYGFSGMSFVCGKFMKIESPVRFDIVMLINFMGKVKAWRGAHDILDFLDETAKETIVMSAAYSYEIDRHLSGDYEKMKNLYTDKYIRNGEFFFQDFIKDYMSPQWEATALSPEFPEKNIKRTMLLKRTKTA